jgi:hypothetical protein
MAANSASPPRWLVTCSCGWDRACVSEWAAKSVSKLHGQLGEVGVDEAALLIGPAGGTTAGGFAEV